MPKGLKRYYGQGHLHFLTFSCYRRLPLLGTARAGAAAFAFKAAGFDLLPAKPSPAPRGHFDRAQKGDISKEV